MTDPGFPLDDSWIHQVFARNIATGHGFSFNPDQPIAGATAPLWTLLLSLSWLLMGPIAGGILPGVIFQLLAYIAIYKITLKLTDQKNLSLVATILSIFCWQTVWGSLSGMETGFFSALSLWGLYFYLKSDSLSDKFSYISYALFTLAFLSRPECALFVAAAVIRDFYEWIKSRQKRLAPWLYKALIILLLTSPYFIFNYWSTGTLLPHTFSAKTRGKDFFSALLNGDFKNVLHTLTIHPYFYLQHFYRKVISINPIIVLASTAGIFKLMLSDGRLHSKRVMIGILFLLYVPLMGTFSPMFSAQFQHFRYVTNLLPVLALMGTLGLFWDKKIDMTRFSKKLIIASAALLVLGLALKFTFKYFAVYFVPFIADSKAYIDAEQFAYIIEIVSRVGNGTFLLGLLLLLGYLINTDYISSIINRRNWRRALIGLAIFIGAAVTVKNADTYANNVRNINECDVYAAIFLGELAKEGDVAAVNDIGSFGYFSKMEIFDLWGLINPDLSYEMMGTDSLVFEYMYSNKRVDYIAIFPNWFPYLSGRKDILKPIKTFVSENNTILAEETTIVYKAEWPDSTNGNRQEQ